MERIKFIDDPDICTTALSLSDTNTNKNTIFVKFKDPEFNPIQMFDQGDWIDLKCAEDITLKQGEYKAISLGIAMRLPEGYEAYLLPRSSTFKKYGILLVNGMGIVDNSYCGNNDYWHFIAYATRDINIAKGDRIAQFRINPTMENMHNISNSDPLRYIVRVHDLCSENRGGIGSTGV